jgi:hypothetical protein
MPERLPLTERQQKQIAYLQRLEPYEDLRSIHTFWVDCKDCNEGKELHSCEGVRCFILNHSGHRTWVTNGGKINPLTRY